MKPNYVLVIHYTDSTATILSSGSFAFINYMFQECKSHPDLAFAILYSKHPTNIGYMLLESFVNPDRRNSFEFVLLGFDKPQTPAGQEDV